MGVFNEIVGCIYKVIVYPLKFILFKIIYYIEKKISHKNLSDVCADCYEKVTLPYYVCPSCNSRYAALMPTFKHIFYFKCSCGNNLPLTTINGKKKLKTLCGKCKNVVKMNKVKKICIPIIGTNSSIKANFIYNMIDTIEWKFQKPPFKAYVSTVKTQRFFEEEKEEFIKEGRFLFEDRGDVFKFFLGKNKKKPSREVYIFDTNEKDLRSSDNLKKYKYFNYYDGIVLIFQGEELKNPCVEELTSNDIIDTFILNLQKNYGLKPGEIINKPVAFIISNPIMESCDRYIEEKFNRKIEKNFSNHRLFLIDNSSLTKQGQIKANYDEAEVFQWILGEIDYKIHNSICKNQ